VKGCAQGLKVVLPGGLPVFLSIGCSRVIDFGRCADARNEAIENFLKDEAGKFGSEQAV
jgi:hypothetical protein